MGRKKKSPNGGQVSNETPLGLEFMPKIDLASDAKRSAAAIVIFTLAILIILGFFDKAGVVGEFLDKVTGSIIGVVKIIFPLFLMASAGVLIFRKETSFYVTKLLGLFISLVSIAGFIHWFYDYKDMLKVAKAGEGGGYVGYFIAYFFTKYLGSAGGFIVILALLLIGIIVAFNFSIVHLLSRLRKEKSEDDEDEAEEMETSVPLIAKAEVAIETAKIETKETKEEYDPEKNIGHIEFVAGRDQYVSPEIVQKGVMLPSRGISVTPKKLFKKKQDDEWQLPPEELVDRTTGVAKGGDIEKNFEIIEKTLRDFGIIVERGEVKVGPAVTQYSFRPAVGVKIAKILALQNDLSLALAAHPIRIEAPIPGKSLVGIEVPNSSSVAVRMREFLEEEPFKNRESNLTIALGKDVSGMCVFDDITKMPHLMVAGSTGTGKSVCVNSIITSLLYQNSPKDLKFIMIDPKRVELSLYNGIPHLLSEVIVENSKVVNALRWAVGEMEKRYRLLQDMGSRDIVSYKNELHSGKKKKVLNPETNKMEEVEMEDFPYIIIVIDELADLMASHGKEVEGAIVRIAQMARAVGIHLLVSTQRPSVEVITGLIKANISTRIAFQVASQIDSRTILDMSGAEKLLGRGDMLFLSSSSPKPRRLQGVLVTEAEVKRVVKFIKSQKHEEESIGDNIVQSEKSNPLEFRDSNGDASEDDLYEAAKEEVIRSKKASASLLQRRLRVGYARAARLIDILEERGIVGPADGAKPREVFAATGETAVNYDDVSQDQEARDKWDL
jgi:S-DNA-T family DNA segregation ATPase FtsK/SpoIIIE